jgi:hypothetical protein
MVDCYNNNVNDQTCADFLLYSQRFNDDGALIKHVEETLGMLWRGMLTPSNFTSVEWESRNNYLYKCEECPTYVRRDQSRQPCVQSRTCCDQYYLVFQSPPTVQKTRISTCCTGQPLECVDQTSWYAVDAFLTPQMFDAKTHMLPLQVEQNTIVADRVIRKCSECVSSKVRYAGAAQWRSCATCNIASPVDTDLVRDSLIRIGVDPRYWQYKPRDRTEADRVHGMFGQSVFRGMGPIGYLPDYRRPSTTLRGGFVPSHIAPRAVSAVMVPRLCDDFACR